MDQWAKVFIVVWVAGALTIWPLWIWYSIHSHRVRGEPLVPRPPAGAQFCERGASATVRGAIFGRARNCLQVSVAGGELWITPTFPFNLVAPYGFMGLDYRTPRSEVTRAERRSGWLGDQVLLDIRQPETGETRTLKLRLRSPDAFLAALRPTSGRPA